MPTKTYGPNNPRMRAGTVEMVSVEWIMKNATGSVDGYEGRDEAGKWVVEYGRMIHAKSTDYQFGCLLGKIMEEGFRVPIVLVKNFKWDGEDSIDGRYDLVHGNGHHRMVAAILLCLDEIPVYWSKGKEYMCTNKSTAEDVEWDENWDGFEEDFCEFIKDDYR